ncbi:MAG: twin-arginine translocation signal domain-containing protein, partial [Rhodocyclaceae bacterium]|nr:twin-arginine translocation signal domain-containing protein [Rhodocyclaceae bacterium]
MLIKRPDDIAPSEITPRELFERRREFIKAAGATALLGAALFAGLPRRAWASGKFTDLQKSPYSVLETPNSLRDITTYNNFVEFGFDGKSQPAERAGAMKTRPWT